MNSRFESLNDGFVQYKSKREKREYKQDKQEIPKPIPKPKLNVHDVNQFPELGSGSSTLTTTKLNFGNLFEKKKQIKKI